MTNSYQVFPLVWQDLTYIQKELGIQVIELYDNRILRTALPSGKLLYVCGEPFPRLNLGGPPLTLLQALLLGFGVYPP